MIETLKFWTDAGDLATWVTTLAVAFAALSLRSGRAQRQREQASKVQVIAIENVVHGEHILVTEDGPTRIDHLSHEIQLHNGSDQPIYFPFAVFARPHLVRWPWVRGRTSRGPLVTYGEEGLVAPGEKADVQHTVDGECYVLFRDSSGLDWYRQPFNQRLRRVRWWSGVASFDNRLTPRRHYTDPRQVKSQWIEKHRTNDKGAS